jgi:cytochrome c-type biogenesis protein CcmH/NrfG
VLFGAAAAVLAVGLIAYGASHLEAAWRLAKVEPDYRAIAQGEIKSVQALDALTQELRHSPFAADLSRAAFAELLSAQQVGLATPLARTRLSATIRDLRTGLRASPADAYAWTRLAVAEVTLHGAGERAARALAMAVRVAPRERKLIALHLDLAVVLWDHLDEAGRAGVKRRVDFAASRPELRGLLAANSARVVADLLRAPQNEQKPR